MSNLTRVISALLCLHGVVAVLPNLKIGSFYLPGQVNRCAIVERLAREYTEANVTVSCYLSGASIGLAESVITAASTDYDIIPAFGHTLPKYAAAGQLVELTDIATSLEYLRTDFFEATMTSVQYPYGSDRFWALPVAADMLGFTYKKSVFAAHNKTTPAYIEELVPLLEYFKNQSEFSRAASALYTCSNLANPTCYTLRLTTTLSTSMLMFGLGGGIWDPETYKIKGILDSDANVDAFMLSKRMYNTALNNSANIGYTDMFAMEANAFCHTPGSAPIGVGFTALQELNYQITCPSALSDTGFFAMPFPKQPVDSRLPFMLSTLVIPKGSNPANREAAKKFLLYLTSHDAQSRGGAWGFPVRKSVVTDPGFVFGNNIIAPAIRLVYVQSLARAKMIMPEVPVGAALLGEAEDTYTGLINTPTLTRDQVKAAFEGLATRQQAIMDARFPCGPVCPEILQKNAGASTTLLAFNAFGLLLCVAIGAGMLWFNKEPVFRASAPTFLYIIIGGACLMFIGGALETVADPSDAMCVGRTWTVNFGMYVIFLAIVVKTYRIAAIFNRKVISKVTITDATLLKYFGAGVVVCLAYLFAWTFAAAPSSSVFRKTSDGMPQQWTECDFGQFSTWNLLLQFLLLMCASVLAFQVRSAPGAFHEAKYLGIAVYNWVVITGLVFLLQSMSDDLQVTFIASEVNILLTAPVILGCIFFPKFFAIFVKADITGDNSDAQTSNNASKLEGGNFGVGPTSPHCKAAPSPRTGKFGSKAIDEEPSKISQVRASSTRRPPTSHSERIASTHCPSQVSAGATEAAPSCPAPAVACPAEANQEISVTFEV